MEEELEAFLVEREAVTQEKLHEMKSEKIDMAAVVEMGENLLQKYIPKIGDRLALVRFCKHNQPPKKSERSSLVERIRKSQFYEEYNSGRKNVNKELSSTEKSKAPNEKSTRIISIGWIMNGTAIREKNGGGTRSIPIEKSAKREDILKKALDFFFPNGVSAKKYGSLSKYTYDLLDYKQHMFDNTFTVGDMYKMTGLTTLRFYLSTNKINESDSSSDTDMKTKKPRKYTKETIKKSKCKKKLNNIEDEKEYESVNVPGDASEELEFRNNTENYTKERSTLTETSFSEDTTFHSTYNVDLLHTDGNSLNEFLIFDNFEQNVAANEAQYSETLSSLRTLILHRGQIFEEMTEEFIAIENMNTLIEIQIMGTNGIKENAFDGGGVFRDALTEYWNEFYDRLCVGSTTRIPEVNYLFNDNKWKAIAKILLVGYQQANYFPIKLSRPFIEYAVFGQTFTNLIDAYMKYISPLDADVINRAIVDFDSVDSSEILDTLTNLECKQVINKENVIDGFQQIAHTTIVQKSLYILQNWNSILKNTLSMNVLNTVYQRSEVTNKSVLQLIQNFQYEDLDARKERVLNFLKKFLREAEMDILRFLRFCTGADIITCDSIMIEFSNEAIPTSHTCNNILLLPVQYDSYRISPNSLAF